MFAELQLLGLGSPVVVDVARIELPSKIIFNIDYPVGGGPGVTAFRALENLLLSYICDSDIVVLTPLLLEPVVNEGKVVAGLSSSFVDTDTVQVERVLLHVSHSKRSLNVLLPLDYLLLHLPYLSRQLVDHIGH